MFGSKKQHNENTDAVLPDSLEARTSNALTHEHGGISSEAYRESMEVFLNTILLDPIHSEKVNEGNNGIILKLSMGPEFMHHVDPNYQLSPDLDEKSQMAAKILKVHYSDQNGHNEFKNQQAAWRLVRDLQTKEKETIIAQNDTLHQDATHFAAVPQPIFFTHLELDDELKHRLSELGAHAHERASILLMDYVEGGDIATILFRKLLQNHPDAAHLQHEHLDQWGIEELHEEVARIFYFAPENEKQDATAIQAAERLKKQNVDILIRELARAGVQVSPHIVTQIKNTIRLFKDNGILLRDAHPRNFMITGDISDEHACATVVDFGDVTLLDRPVEETDYDDPVHAARYEHMDNIVHLLESINREARKIAEKQAGMLDTVVKRRMHALAQARNIFEKRNENALGLATSRDQTKNRIPYIESAIDEAIDGYKETGTWSTRSLRAAFKDTSGKSIRPTNPDGSKKNELWNSNALLSAILGKVYAAAKQGILNEGDIRTIVADLGSDEKFREVIEDNEHWRYWTNVDFDNDVPSMIWDASQKQ